MGLALKNLWVNRMDSEHAGVLNYTRQPLKHVSS